MDCRDPQAGGMNFFAYDTNGSFVDPHTPSGKRVPPDYSGVFTGYKGGEYPKWRVSTFVYHPTTDFFFYFFNSCKWSLSARAG